MKIESIVIVGRKWLDRFTGKDYYSAEVVVNGELVHKITKHEGGRDQHIISTNNWLSESGYLDNPRKGSMNLRKPLWKLKDEIGFLLHSSIDSVSSPGAL